MIQSMMVRGDAEYVERIWKRIPKCKVEKGKNTPSEKEIHSEFDPSLQSAYLFSQTEKL